MPAKARPVADMLTELKESLSTTRVIEGRLRCGAQLHGLCDFDGHTIYIDPTPGIVLHFLHELTHARWPSWSERRIERESRRLFVSLDDAGIDHWFRVYMRTRQRAKRPVQVAHLCNPDGSR